MPKRLFGVFLCLVVASCGGDSALEKAEASLHRFHQALVTGNRQVARDTVTRASQLYVARLPKGLPNAKLPLRVISAARRDDFDKDCPHLIFFRQDGNVCMATLRIGLGYARRYARLRWDD